MRLLFVWILFLFSLSNVLSSEQSYFHSLSGSFGDRNCSLSQVKLDGKCVLLTNAHCNPNMTTPLRLSSSRGEISFDKVISYNYELDLLIYETPPELGRSCQNLASLPTESNIDHYNSFPSTNRQVRIIGQTLVDGEMIEVNETVEHDGEISENTIRTVETSYEAGTEWELNSARAYLGISGGMALFGDEEVPIGLVKGTIPGVNVARIIPNHVLLDHIRQSLIVPKPKYQYQNIDGISHIVESSTSDPRSPSTSDPRSPSTSDPRSPSTSDPRSPNFETNFIGDCVNVNDLFGLTAFEYLLETQQGIMKADGTGINELVAIRCGNDGFFQGINELNKVRHLLRNFFISPKDKEECGGTSLEGIPIEDMIFRDADGNLPLEVRRSLFDRMAGTFIDQGYQSEEINETMEYDISETIRNSQPINPKETKRTEAELEIKENNISLSLDGRKVELKLTPSEDFKSMTLVSSEFKAPLSCRNNNFNKLICRNNSEMFSIALDHSQNGKSIHWRMGKVKEDGKTFSFSHGALVSNTGNHQRNDRGSGN